MSSHESWWRLEVLVSTTVWPFYAAKVAQKNTKWGRSRLLLTPSQVKMFWLEPSRWFQSRLLPSLMETGDPQVTALLVYMPSMLSIRCGQHLHNIYGIC